MKRSLQCLLLSAVVLLSLVGCNNTPPVDEAVNTDKITTPNTFMLNRLPDIGEYEMKNEKYTRFYEQYTDTLIPRDDYGTLVPFAGDVAKYSSREEGWIPSEIGISYSNYGLCTLDGKIVVDAVYSNVYLVESEKDSKKYYVLQKDIANVKADDYYNRTTTTLVTCDGSWSLDLGTQSVMQVYGDRIITHGGDLISGADVSSHILDMNGKQIWQSPVMDGWCSLGTLTADGLIPVYIYSYKTNESSAYYIDTDGKRQKHLTGFTNVSEFVDGYAVVTIDSNSGVIDKEGKPLYQITYSSVYYNSQSKLFVLKTHNDETYLGDLEGNLELIATEGNVSLCGSNKDIIYHRTRDDSKTDSYFFLDTKKPVLCKETDSMPISDSGDYFLCKDEDGIAYFFDRQGETILKVDNCSDYFYAMDNRYIVANREDSYENNFVIDAEKKELVLEIKGNVNNVIGGKYLVVNLYDDSEETITYDINASVFDLEKKEYIIEKADNNTIREACDGMIFFYNDDNYVYTLDEQLNVIIKMRKGYND